MTTLRELEYQLQANTQGLDKAIPALNKLVASLNKLNSAVNQSGANFKKKMDESGKAARRQAEETKKAAATVRAAMKRQEAALLGARSRMEALNQEIRRSGAPPRLLANTTRAYNSLEKTLQKNAMASADLTLRKAKYSAALANVTRALKQFNAEQTRSSTASQSSTLRAAEAMKRYEAAIIQARAATDSLTSRLGKFKGTEAEINAANAAYRRYEATLRQTGLTAGDAAIAKARLSASLTRVRNTLPIKETNLFSSRLREMSQMVVLAIGPLSGFGARMTALAGLFDGAALRMAAFVAGGVGATVMLAKMASNTIKTAYELDGLNARLKVGAGSAGAAAVYYDKLWKMADNLGLEFVSLANQFGKFSTAATGTNIEGRKTFEIFEAVAGAAAKLRLATYETQGIFKAFEQMVSKGTVQAEELRNQLGDRLYGAFNIAARGMGVTTQALGKMLKSGKVLTDDFLPKFVTEMKKALGIRLDERMDTLRASTNRLYNSIFNFNKTLDENLKLSSLWKKGIEALTKIIDYASKHMDGLISAVTGIAAAFAAWGILTLVGYLGSLAGAIVTVTRAVAALNFTIGLTPIGLLIKIISLAVGGYAAYKTMGSGIEEAAKEQKKFNDLTIDYIKSQKSDLRLQQDVTQSYLDGLKDKTKATQVAMASLAGKINKVKTEIEEAKTASSGLGILEPLSNYGNVVANKQKELKELQGTFESYNGTLEKYMGYEKELKKIMADQDAEEKRREGIRAATELTEKEINALRRKKEALSEANEAIYKAQTQLNTATYSPQAQEEVDAYLRRINVVDEFKDKLEKAKVAQSEINRLTSEYSYILEQLDVNSKLFEKIASLYSLLEDSATKAITSTSDALVDFVVTGEGATEDIGKMFKKMAADIIKELIKILVYKPLIDSLMMAFGGNSNFIPGTSIPKSFTGNAFTLYGKGGVVGSPTLFAQGGTSKTGIMGEAGAEGILPLARTRNGDLGVKMIGGGSMSAPINVIQQNIRIINNGDNNVETRQTKENGQDYTDIIISPVAKAMNQGRFDGTLNQRTGGKPRTIRRGYGG